MQIVKIIIFKVIMYIDSTFQYLKILKIIAQRMGLELFSHSKLEVSEKCTAALHFQHKRRHGTKITQPFDDKKNEFLIFSWPELLSTKVKHKQFWSYCHSAVKLQISKNFIEFYKGQNISKEITLLIFRQKTNENL